MYIDIAKSQGKYVRYLLRKSYREKGKVKHRTIANLSCCALEEIEVLRFALKHKKYISSLLCKDIPLTENGFSLPRMLAPALGVKSTLDIVKKRGALFAGVRSDVSNFGFIDETGNHVGFEIDLVKEIAKRLEVKLKLVPVTSSSRTPLLLGGRIDLIAATMTHYRRRQKNLDFSIGYMRSPQTLLVKKGKSIKSLSDVMGKRAAVSLGSGAGINLHNVQPKARLQNYQNYFDAFRALLRDEVDILATDIVILKSLYTKAPDPEEFDILSRDVKFGGGEWAIALPKNDSEWRHAINQCLQDIWNEGIWDHIFHKWLGPNTHLAINKNDLDFRMVVWH